MHPNPYSYQQYPQYQMQPAQQPQNNLSNMQSQIQQIQQQLQMMGQTPEQMVRTLLSNGSMTQEQFMQLSHMADQIVGR